MQLPQMGVLPLPTAPFLATCQNQCEPVLATDELLRGKVDAQPPDRAKVVENQAGRPHYH